MVQLGTPPTTAPPDDFVLVLSCPDRPGIVHAVRGFLVEHGGNIVESQQFGDRRTGRFFMRIDFRVDAAGDAPTRCARDFAAVADAVRAWTSSCGTPRRRTGRWSWSRKHAALPQRPALPRQHRRAADRDRRRSSPTTPTAEPLVRVLRHRRSTTSRSRRTPRPRPRRGCWSSSTRARRRPGGARPLHAGAVRRPVPRSCRGRAINIHHSFLPSFKGARPYHQAYDRGVKLIGATAHYVTADLDEGPIIEQDVDAGRPHLRRRTSWSRAGRDVEAQVLSRAVRWHAEHRVLLNGDRTVVFR